jgi:hypothetical protein
MMHNSNYPPEEIYQNVESDISYFGMMNTRPVLELLANQDNPDEKLV